MEYCKNKEGEGVRGILKRIRSNRHTGDVDRKRKREIGDREAR